MPSRKQVTFASIAEHFHLPIVEVAGILGVCTTVLKKVCRRNGIRRWPQRKLQSLNKRIDMLEDNLTNEIEFERNQLCSELGCLKKRRLSLTTPLISLDAPVREHARQQRAAELILACDVDQRSVPTGSPPLGGTVVLAHAESAKRPRDDGEAAPAAAPSDYTQEMAMLRAAAHLPASVLAQCDAVEDSVTAQAMEPSYPAVAVMKAESAIQPRGLFQNASQGLHPIAHATLEGPTTLRADKVLAAEVDDARNPALALLELCGRGSSTDTQAPGDASAADLISARGAAGAPSASPCCGGGQLSGSLAYMAAASTVASVHASGTPQVVQAQPMMMQASQAALSQHNFMPASLSAAASPVYWNTMPGSTVGESASYWSIGEAVGVWPGQHQHQRYQQQQQQQQQQQHQQQYSLRTSAAPISSVRPAPTPTIQVPVQSARAFRTGVAPALAIGNVLKSEYDGVKPRIALHSNLLPSHSCVGFKERVIASQAIASQAITTQLAAQAWGEHAALLSLHRAEASIASRYSSPSDITTIDLMAQAAPVL